MKTTSFNTNWTLLHYRGSDILIYIFVVTEDIEMGLAGRWDSTPLGPPGRNRAGSARLYAPPPANTPTPSCRDSTLFATIGSRKVVEPLPDMDEVVEVEFLKASIPSSSDPDPET